MSLEDRAKRLNPLNLRADAERILELNGGDALVVITQLLRQVRQHDDQEEAIRLGYGSSAKMERELNELLLNQEHIEIARAIEREIRRKPPTNQRLDYAGGLRRAARIARGWR